jgi:tetratricopeptide (TPR) repeat protein
MIFLIADRTIGKPDMSKSYNGLPQDELIESAQIWLAIAEKYGSMGDFDRLEEDLPDLLAIVRDLAEESNANIADLENPRQVTIVKEPAGILNDLVKALFPFLTETGRSRQLLKFGVWAYAACIGLKLWEDAAYHASELARLHYNRQRLTETNLWLERASKVIRKSKNKSRMADINFLRGQLASSEDNYKKAQLYFKQAEKLFREQKRVDGAVLSLLELALMKKEEKQYPAALQAFEQAYRQAEEVGLEQYVAESCYHLGVLNFQKRDYPTALEWLKRGLHSFNRFEDKTLEEKIRRLLTRVQERIDTST